MKRGVDRLTKERRQFSPSPRWGLELRGKQRKEFGGAKGSNEPSAGARHESLGRGEVSPSKDRLTKERRSWNMSRIKGKNTSPELIVRRLLHKMGFRFRLHVRIPIPEKPTRARNQRERPLLGERIQVRANFPLKSQLQTSNLKPETSRRLRAVSVDIVLPKYKTAIFVHGCFWHRHKGCKNCTTPTNRREWWLEKLNGNAARDKRHQKALKKLGWRVIVLWECQTKNATEKMFQRLERIL